MALEALVAYTRTITESLNSIVYVVHTVYIHCMTHTRIVYFAIQYICLSLYPRDELFEYSLIESLYAIQCIAIHVLHPYIHRMHLFRLSYNGVYVLIYTF